MYPPKTCPLLSNQILSFLQNTPPGPTPLLTFLIHLEQWASIGLITDSSFTISHTVFELILWAYRHSSFTRILLAKHWAQSIKKRERKSNDKTTNARLRMCPVLCILPPSLNRPMRGTLQWSLLGQSSAQMSPPRHLLSPATQSHTLHDVHCSIWHQQDRCTYFFVILLPPLKPNLAHRDLHGLPPAISSWSKTRPVTQCAGTQHLPNDWLNNGIFILWMKKLKLRGDQILAWVI